jgi:hypothetical protein
VQQLATIASATMANLFIRTSLNDSSR